MHWSYYTNKSIGEVFEELKTSPAGLLKQEAVLRQKNYGLNEVSSKKIGIFDILVRQAKSPFFYLLLIAGIVAFFIGEKIDSLVIMIFIVVNLVIGFLQEYKAERTISLLKNIISSKTTVVREGSYETIEKKYLVPGDIVSLSLGDMVPAELRVLHTENFLVDESVLTGESAPVLKNSEPLPSEEKEVFKSTNILFTGTSVISGKALGIVVGTGEDTALGNIVASVQEKRPQGVYEKDLMYFCRLMLKIVVTTVFLIFLLNLIIKGTENFFEFSLFCVALIVSILPEALPAIVILALSRGSMKMAKENVVVKRLSAIEDLGNIEILCTDKTGTLTQNKLSLEKIVSFNKSKAVLYGLLGSPIDEEKKSSLLNPARGQSGLVESQKKQTSNGVNPFDVALKTRADWQTLKDIKKYRIVKELAFDSFRMRSSFLIEGKNHEKILITKGAPEVILKLCSTFPAGYKRNEIKENIAKEGQDGKRVLMVAFKTHKKDVIAKEDERGLTFLGYFVFEDPLKTTAEEAIRLAKKLGVQIKIITGDSKEVAHFVSKKTGLINNASEVMLGQDLENMHQEEFNNACQDYAVFARISPDIKHRIIKSLQRNYEVGFLGEGINDVPALEAANVGIAVFEATDIAKEASDIVLLKKDLRVIINGIKDGRMVFSNINKYIKCSLSSNFGNFYSIAVISLFIPFLPMLPVQILLGNLLSDFPLISIVTDSVDIEELRKPKAYQLHNILPLIIALGLVSTVFDFLFFLIFYKDAPANIQTLWFIESIITELLLVFIIRTRHVFWKAKKPSFSLVFLSITAGLATLILPFTHVGQSFFHFAKAPLSGVLVVMVLVILYIALSEIVKLVYFKYFKMKDRKFDLS